MCTPSACDIVILQRKAEGVDAAMAATTGVFVAMEFQALAQAQARVVDFFIACDQDFEHAKRLVYEAAATSRYLYLGKSIAVVVREGPVPGSRERFAIRLTVKAYVFDGRYEVAFGTDITERVKRAFDQHGIRTAGQLADAESMLLTSPRPAHLGSVPP